MILKIKFHEFYLLQFDSCNSMTSVFVLVREIRGCSFLFFVPLVFIRVLAK